MDIIAAYNDQGSFRGAAAICGVDPKTVKAAVLRRSAPSPLDIGDLRAGRHGRRQVRGRKAWQRVHGT
jgi:hypothetical protein